MHTLVSIQSPNAARVCGLTYYSHLSRPPWSWARTGVLHTHMLGTLLPWGRRGRAVCPLVMTRDWAGGAGGWGWGWAGAGRGRGAAGEWESKWSHEHVCL